jgi:hypothetical protein
MTTLTLLDVQNALDGMIEPTVRVKGKWLTFKATQSWAECGESFKAIKAQHGLKSLFYRGGTIGIRAENVTIPKPAKASRKPAPEVFDTAATIMSLVS